ncbi:uncharacterized protein LOC133320770 [Danaus plexippus]|uniref:uncharacterized protein LOC133320770 n=1 Tax=Danaus plexippus TaxID=13037 RepID=UPI002AB13B34|nr:uncharacterized protein LOC133320770 [Danaus plexippus]
MIEGLRWPSEFETTVNMSKVDAKVLSKWISQRITELLGFEDDIIIDYCKEQLFQETDNVCPKKLQINLTGFLSKNASRFVRELWSLLISAQSSANGIPPRLLEQKKVEMEARQEHAKQINEVLATSLEISATAKAAIPENIRASSLERSGSFSDRSRSHSSK